MKIILKTFLLFVLASPLLAQKVRGISAVGSLSVKEEVGILPKELVCTIMLSEEFVDETWSPDERLELSVLVRNYNPNNSIQPKLEICIQSAATCPPIMQLVPLDMILPGEKSSYSCSLNWQACFKEFVVFRVRAFDSKFDFATDWTEVTIDTR